MKEFANSIIIFLLVVVVRNYGILGQLVAHTADGETIDFEHESKKSKVFCFVNFTYNLILNHFLIFQPAHEKSTIPLASKHFIRRCRFLIRTGTLSS